MLASTLLISAGPKPVTVRLCLGLEIPAGPMGPLKSVMGADELGRRSRAGASVLEAMVGVARLVKCVMVLLKGGGVCETGKQCKNVPAELRRRYYKVSKIDPLLACEAG